MTVLTDTPILDSDSHVSEPADLWSSRVPSKWADQAPRLEYVEALGERRWRVGDALLSAEGEFAAAGWPSYAPSHPKSLEEADPAAWDPKARLQRLDEYGVRAQVLYPNVLGFFPRTFMRLEPELARACVVAYNDFLAEFAAEDSDRLVPIMMLPFWDIEASIAELSRAAALGHRGVLLASNYQKFGIPDLWDDRWEPLLKEIESRGLSINFHIGFSDAISMDEVKALLESSGDEHTRHTVPAIMSNVSAVCNVVCTGLCHRYPGINFVSVENGASWLPYVMESLDWNWKGFGAYEMHPEMELPSFYIRRQVYGTFWFERESIARTIEIIPDNIMFETDFPHPVSLAPGAASAIDVTTPRQMAEVALKDCPDEIVRKVFWENGARLYGLSAPEAATSTH